MSDGSPQPLAAAATVDQALLSYTHVAVVMNYARRSATRGTLLESHFRWQLRTFWFAVLWACLSFLFMATIIGIPAALVGLLALTIWIVYRLVRGWLALRDKRPMYV